VTTEEKLAMLRREMAERALLELRVMLFGAMQTLDEEMLVEFWKLIDDVTMCRRVK
jgi:hypothetical protein